MSFLLLVGFALAQDPFAYVAEKDAYFASLLKSEQFDDIARMYHPNALLISSDMPTGFVKQPKISDFWKEAMKENTNHTLGLKPYKIEAQDGILHEIATVDFNGTQSFTYTQWIRDEMQGWLIHVDCLTIGIDNGPSSADRILGKEPSTGPMDALAEIYKSFMDQFNAGKIEEAYNYLYAEEGRYIDKRGDTIWSSGPFVRLMKILYSVYKPTFVSFTSLYVYEESDTVWHEIGQSKATAQGHSEEAHFYYTRWERKNSTDQWKQVLNLANIGGLTRTSSGGL